MEIPSLAALRDLEVEPCAPPLLRLVQAGVAAGSRRVTVRILARQVSVTFESPEHLEAMTGNPTGGSAHRCLAHLRAGLVGLARGGSRELECRWWTHGQGRRLVLSDSGAVSQPCPALEGPPGFRVLATRPGDEGLLARLGFRPRQTAEEHKQVMDRCCYSPVPVVLDGLDVSHYATPFPGRSRLFPRQRLAERYLVGPATHPDWPCFETPWLQPVQLRCWGSAEPSAEEESPHYRALYQDFRRATDLNTADDAIEPLDCKHVGCSALLVLTNESGPGQIVFLQDGVTLEPVPGHPECPGVYVLAAGEGLVAGTDFRPLDSDRLKARLFSLRDEAQHLCVRHSKVAGKLADNPRWHHLLPKL